MLDLRGDNMTIQAPYRFVPLSKLIVLPEWGNQVSHDKPFKDGICGELDILLTAQSDICVGGEQIPATKDNAGIVKFFTTPDGKPAIPASSLKGMLRNVLEIATFSRFKQVEDQKLGVRDISESDNFYAEKMKNQKAGWLKFNGKKWIITPCSFYRVHQQDILDYFDIKESNWKKLNTVKERYMGKVDKESGDYYRGLQKICPIVYFNEETLREKNGKKIVNITQSANSKGSLVVTGQPGAFFTKNRAKKYEFIFFKEQEDRALAINSDVMSGFNQIHADTDEWKFWLSNIDDLKQGIPVFYHTNGNKVTSLGLAYMYKLAYTYSIHDAIGHTNKHHIEMKQPDFADLLFGFIDDEDALRGRVNIGMGFLQQNDVTLKVSQPTVLSSPKASYYPLYIRQTSNKNFCQLMQNNAQLSGWKRYQVKPVEILDPPEKSKTTVQVRFEMLPENTVFNHKIRFHNLRPVELGALLWVLDFGGRKQLNHQVGIGKPYGLGQVKLNVNNSKLRRNDTLAVENSELFLMACKQEFVDYMQGIFKSFNEDWEKSDTLKSLFSYAAVSDANNLDYLGTPKAYADLRKREFLDEFIQNFHQYEPTKISKENELNFDYHGNLNQQINNVKNVLAKALESQARSKAKEDATDEDRILFDLQDFIAQAEVEMTKTIKGNASKKFKVPFEESWNHFNDEQKEKFRQLATQVEKLIADKAFTKLVKKINDAE